jgi:hypothetical protein
MYMKDNCYTLLWAPAGDAVAANIVANIMANNDPPIAEAQVKAFATADAANAWMQQDGNFERTLGAYEFFVDYTLQNIDFGIQIVRVTLARVPACGCMPHARALMQRACAVAERHDQAAARHDPERDEARAAAHAGGCGARDRALPGRRRDAARLRLRRRRDARGGARHHPDLGHQPG